MKDELAALIHLADSMHQLAEGLETMAIYLTGHEEKKEEQKSEEAKEETPAEAEQEEAAEKDLNEMTADELFAYLMTVSGDDMDALYEKYPNLDELTAAFSEEQMQELTAHFGGDQVAELDITGASQVKVGESVTLTGTKSVNRNSDHSTL